MSRESEPENTRRSKPHGIQPSPPWRTDGAPFGLAVLDEISDPTISVALWLALRFIQLWTITPAPRRRRLRGRNSAIHQETAVGGPEIRDATATFAAFVQRPASVSWRAVAEACDAIRSWAVTNGYSETALHFAEAGAYLDPEQPKWANEAGAQCRRAGLMDRASIWIMRGHGLSRRADDKDQKLRALLAQGVLMKETGRIHEAEDAFRAAANAALRRNQRGKTAEAHHDLMLLLAENGRLAECVESAALAADYYPLHHPRMPYLAHDFAFGLLRAGLYSDAFRLLSVFIGIIPQAHLLPGLGTYAWAAAGCGMADRFTEAEQNVLRIVDDAREHAPASYIHLAEGARLLSRWDRAVVYADRAIHAATCRRDPILEEEARQLAVALEHRQAAVLLQCPADRRLLVLTRHFAARLRGWKSEPAARTHEGETEAVGNCA
jgi:tetratricopeptide (TPR) repeat protein